MNKNFELLKPEAVWRHFVNIMSRPHPSMHEDAIREYATGVAKDNGLEYTVDAAGNVLISKAATAGMESRQGVILQAHMDMVPQKNNDKEFDFTKDPIEGYIDGEWVRANGTTLGADNGIGMAAALAILEDKAIAHGPIEVLLTSNEEAGMDGVNGLSNDLLKGSILLNLDTEEDDELCIGCAGGMILAITFEHESVPTPQGGEYVARRLEIKGLKGGHSGCQINEQRANANKLLFRFLRFTKLDILLCSVSGGTLHNAIPREAYADLLIHNDDLALFEEQVAKYAETVREEFKTIDGDATVELLTIDYPQIMIDEDSAACMIWAIAGCPDGVNKMSYSIPGLVQTSSNLAVVKSDETTTKVGVFIRSSSDSEKVALADTIASIFELADADVECESDYPGWMPNPDSKILTTVKEGYNSLFGEMPHVGAVHAGLECGLIGALYPEMDMISFGPTIVSPHSPAECVNISSVEKFYKLLTLTLENIPTK